MELHFEGFRGLGFRVPKDHPNSSHASGGTSKGVGSIFIPRGWHGSPKTMIRMGFRV